MLITPFRDWLVEQENRRGTLFFLVEWLIIFAVALAFWVILLLEIHGSPWSVAAAAAISSLYASVCVYIRLLRLSACRKCHIPLALGQQEIGRRYVQDRERCLEIERGGEEWYGHFIDLYTRHYRIEVVKYRCRRCNRVWEKSTEEPAGNYELVRTINVKD
jgi:hypothetical protein